MKSWLAVVVAVAGCGGAKAPVCNPDGPNSCAGVDAMCIPAYGVCASPDLSCPTSYRYDSSSGAMAGQCVPSTIEIPSSLKWTAQPPPAGADSDLQGIWGGSTNDLWAVGRAGGIVHGVNGAWSTVTSPVAGTALTGIWGSGANDVWAIGITGTIIHYDGTNWSRAQSPTASDLNAIWGADANHVWIAGADATLLQLAGAKWTLVDFSMPARGTFGALWGSRPDDVYVVGNDGVSGVIGHFDGAWTFAEQPSLSDIWSVGGSAASDVWVTGQPSSSAMGSELLHWDGAAWSPGRAGPAPGSIWASGSDDAWGIAGSAIYHYDAKTGWARRDLYINRTFAAIYGFGPHDVWIAGSGSNGALLFHGQ